MAVRVGTGCFNQPGETLVNNHTYVSIFLRKHSLLFYSTLYFVLILYFVHSIYYLQKYYPHASTISCYTCWVLSNFLNYYGRAWTKPRRQISYNEPTKLYSTYMYEVSSIVHIIRWPISETLKRGGGAKPRTKSQHHYGFFTLYRIMCSLYYVALYVYIFYCYPQVIW